MSTDSRTSTARALSHGAIRKRMIRSNSEKQRDFAKNTTMTSFRPKFERLLQQGKVDQILNTDPHSKANLFYTTHINELEMQLCSTKKSLGTMVMKSKTKEYNINRIKNEIAKIDRESAILRGEKVFTKNKLQETKQKLEKKQESLEDKVWVEKSYQSVNVRLEKDEYFFRTQNKNKQFKIEQLKQEIKILQSKYAQLCQLNRKLKYSVFEARKINKQQTEEKNQFIALLNQEMAQKQILQNLRIAKYERESSINQLAPSLIEQEQLHKYLEILFTHKLVSQILKTKGRKIMQKYQQVQSAYMYIKSNTNIIDMGKILQRMQQQDEQYEKQLNKVSVLESELKDIDSEMKDAVIRQHHILSQDGTDFKHEKREKYQGMERDRYEMLVAEKEKMLNRRTQDQIMRKKIAMWVEEYSRMFDSEIKVCNQADFFKQLELLSQSLRKRLIEKLI